MVFRCIHDHDGVAVIGNGKEGSLGGIQNHFAGLAARLDSADNGRRGAQIDDYDFPVAQAGDVCFVVALEYHVVGIFAAGLAFARRITFARTQIQFSHNFFLGQINQRDRIVHIVGDEQPGAIAAYGQPCRHRLVPVVL